MSSESGLLGRLAARLARREATSKAGRPSSARKRPARQLVLIAASLWSLLPGLFPDWSSGVMPDFSAVAWAASPIARKVAKTLEFDGQVVIPASAVLPTRRISLTLSRVGTARSAQAFADSYGRFRFRKVLPGTYSLSIRIPGFGEMPSATVDVTASFADSKGRVEKTYSYDEAALARPAPSSSRGLVSVQELGIPRKARREFEKAQGDLQHGKVENARQHLEKAVEIAPQYTEALNDLGIIAFQGRNFPAAESYFRKALERDSRQFAPLVNLGGALLALGRADEAVEINGRAHQERPTDPLAAAQLGMSYELAGKDAQALKYLLLTERLDPNHYTNPQLALAKIYLRRSDAPAASAELNDFLKRHPDSPEAESVRQTLSQLSKLSQIGETVQRTAAASAIPPR